MEDKKYVVHNGTENIGPLTFSVILQMVAVNELKATDQLYLEESKDWILICQHPEFTKNFKPKAMPQPTTVASATTSASVTQLRSEPQAMPEIPMAPASMGPRDLEGRHWFLLKGENRQGPFSQMDVLRMLQQKVAFEYDYLWKEGLAGWVRVAELPEFSNEQVRALMGSKEAKREEVFTRRKHPRLSYQCPVIAHDNQNYWTGYTVELGEGGAGVVIENSMIMPGQNVYIHFRPGDQTKAFNVLCEVVSKKYVKNLRNRNKPMVYGVKFINIPKSERDLIKALAG